jgi:putative toxin-antitoxin system antitoxin component (TIGR02293 family)
MEREVKKHSSAYVPPKARSTKSVATKATGRSAAEPEVKDKAGRSNSDLAYWLGGTRLTPPIKSEFDVIDLGHKGLPKAAIDALATHMGITRKAIAEDIFDLSVKTLERKSPRELMDKKTSSHALEIARVMGHALMVFEEEEKVRRWINQPNRALNNRTPVQLFDTLTGLNLVNDILGRIEEGVYS